MEDRAEVSNLRGANMNLTTKVEKYDNNMVTKDSTMVTMQKNNHPYTGGNKNPERQAVRPYHKDTRNYNAQEKVRQHVEQ